MSHRTAGIQFPAESDPVQTRVEDNSHSPGLGYLSTEMPTCRELPLSIPSQLSTNGSFRPDLDRDRTGSEVSATRLAQF